MLPDLDLSAFHYQLPEERIAQYPLAQRDLSKLLMYKEGSITHHQFKDIVNLLPENSSLIVNDTQVIPARLIFRKPTGAAIEIFLLSPVTPSAEMQSAMTTTGRCSWTCMIGNQKRWRPGQVLTQLLSIDNSDGQQIQVEARQSADQMVEFSWTPEQVRFEQIVEAFGMMPLPPYMKRAAQVEDLDRYQTVYAQYKGAVAAPTAGLHFTNKLMEQLGDRGIKQVTLTLHVGAGTFQPIKTSAVTAHPMHEEQMIVTRSQLSQLAQSTFRVAVGTTSLRTLESLYWYGVKLAKDHSSDFFIEKLYPYQDHGDLPSFERAIEVVMHHMDQHQLRQIKGSTEIFIFPSYQIRSIHALITNFHLPQSTLILLVAALVGEKWREIYQTALDNHYRFLSYGDSSLLFNPSLPQNYG